MMLIGIIGEKRVVIDQLFASAKTPALVIDCANAANPHRLKVLQENLMQFHVVPIELLYAFRDISKNIPEGFESVIVTPIDVLFNYHNSDENLAIYSQTWDNLRKHKGLVYVGIVKNSMHEKYAQLYCDKIIMGHTADSQRVNLQIMQQELRAYAKILDPTDRAVFEKLLIYPLQHIGSITFASSIHAWAFQTLSVSLELFKQHMMLKEAHEELVDKILTMEQRINTLEENNGNVVSRYVSQQRPDSIVDEVPLVKHPY